MDVFTLLQVFLIIFFHWVADFLMQTPDMATQKSKSNYWLTKHVKAYMFGILPITFLVVFFGGNVGGAFFWWAANGALHWITDYFTSRWVAKLKVAEKYYGFPSFFSVIGLDQVIHYTCLFGTYTYFTYYL